MAPDDAAELWGSADYEEIAKRFAPIHSEIVEALEPARGTRWLDVATGTGGVALRAAESGAEVVGIDIAPRMVELARRKADGLPVRFDVGDAQKLPYGDGEFDVVSSSFGIIFAPDHGAVAQELGRVCRSRLGLTVWRPNAELAELYHRFDLEGPEGRAPFEWGRREHLEELLGEAFELDFAERTWFLEGETGEDIWQFWSTSAPPFKAMIGALEPEPREAFRRAYIEYCEQFRANGRVAFPRAYLLVLGERR